MSTPPKLRALRKGDADAWDVRVAKAAVPLVDAARPTEGELPGYARERLKTKVRQTLGRSATERRPARGTVWKWRWSLGLAAAATVILLFTVRPHEKEVVIQVAVLDTLSGTRGVHTNELAAIQEVWPATTIQHFGRADELSAWEDRIPAGARQAFANIVYDRNAAKVRVAGRVNGRSYEKIFPVEADLPATLKRVAEFVREQNALPGVR